MERRLALATAGAVAATLGIATVCAAVLGGGTLFGLAGDGSAAQIVPGASVEQVTRVVVVRSSDSSVAEPVASAVPEPAPTPAVVSPAASPTPVVAVVGTAAPSLTTATPPPTTTKVTTTTAKPATPTTAKPVTATSAAPVTTNAPTTNAPTTTVKPATPTTVRRPPGVPADWPADKPIPPMPAGCQDPQLELNGVWNCDD